MSSVCISVILPVYNKESYIADVLNDLRQQSFPDYECIVIDDGSQDRSGAICDQFAGLDPRFRVIHIQNGGVSHARNVGIGQAAGKYLTFVDGDDRLHPDYLQALHACMEECHADLVVGNWVKVWKNPDSSRDNIHPFYGKADMHDVLPSFAQWQSKTGVFGYCWAKLFRRELADDIRFDESIRLAEDFDYYLKLYPRVKTICFHDKPYYYYLQDAQNSTAIISDRYVDYLSQLKITLRYRAFLQSQNAYTGQNQQIVSEKLSNYTFFTLFHSHREEIPQKFRALRSVMEAQPFALHGTSWLQKWVFFTLKHDLPALAKASLLCYDAAKHVLRR